MALSQLGAGLLGFVHRLLQPAAWSRKLFHAENSAIADAEPFGRTALVCRRWRIICLVLFLGGLVPVELALNPAETVGSGADQVSFDVSSSS